MRRAPSPRSLLAAISLLAALPACSSPSRPAPSALGEAARLAEADPGLARALAPTARGLRAEGGALRAEPGSSLDPRLPLRADGAREIGPAGARLRLTLEGAAASAAELDEGRALYAGVYPEVDAVLTASEGRVEELFLLRSARAASHFRYRVERLGPSVIEPAPDGGLGVRDGAGRLSLRMPPAFAIDARGARRAARLSFEGQTLSLSLSTEGLVFPVLLDPAFESASWQYVQGPQPSARDQLASTFDSKRGETLVFGGVVDGTLLAWNGAFWRPLSTSGPPPRVSPMLAYDAGRDLTVLFGGAATSADEVPFGDTWLWDGATFTKVQAQSPPPRRGGAMVYDSVRKVVLLFGGHADATDLSDTWAWNGSLWTQVGMTSPKTPPARVYGAMAFDDSRGKAVLFGGQDDKNVSFGDTWEWDGSAWSEVSTGGPAARFQLAMAYDGATKKTLLFGGNPSSGAAADLWAWDGASWAELAPKGPPARRAHAASFDSARNKLVVFGGISAGAMAPLGDLWEWDGAAWVQRSPQMPSPRGGGVLVYDAAKKLSLLYGGADGDSSNPSVFGDLWQWDGAAWAPVPFAAGPPGLYGYGATYDKKRGVVVVFGGSTGPFGTTSGETWQWDGSAWSKASAAGPPPRGFPSMLYDPVRAVSVLFGGFGADTSTLGDTWTWDGKTWKQIPTAIAPPARWGSGFVFDDKLGVGVLFGGQTMLNIGGGTDLADTFTWDGASWKDVSSAKAPPGRFGHTLVYDDIRKTVVLFGGLGLADTWAWDSGWTELKGNTPGTRLEHAMVFDSARGNAVLFGGKAQASFGDTWLYASQGAGCKAGAECDSGFCVDGVCCDVASCATCQSCAGSPPGACTSVTSADDPDTCKGSVSCDASGACRKVGGLACAANGDCVSGFCVDGVCCDGACGAPCSACSAAAKGSGVDGVCGLVLAGKAHNGDCKDDGAPSCKQDGACDGQGGCRLYAKGVACGAAACLAQGDARVTSSCDGGGACQQSPASCGEYACRAGACLTACASFADCAVASYCAGGACIKRGEPGAVCASADTCLSGFCVDGVCCNSACAGQCEACDLKSTVGTCAPTIDAPRGARPACGAPAGGDVCSQRRCDGVDTASCQGFTSSAVSCGVASCQAGVATLAVRCDGKGGCAAPQTKLCEPFVCAGAACGQPPCSSDRDCSLKFRCDAQKHDCVPIEGSSCDGDHTLTNPAGARTDCSPFKCAGSACVSSCHSIQDCVSPAVCEISGACALPAAASLPDSPAGCGCRAVTRAPPARGALALLALALAGVRRLRAPKRSPQRRLRWPPLARRPPWLPALRGGAAPAAAA